MRFIKVNDLLREQSAKHEKELLEKAGGLSMMEFQTIMVIGVRSPCRAVDIADALTITPGAVSQILSKLEKRAYLKREHAKEDRRVVHVTLLKKGKRIFDIQQEHVGKVYADWASRMTDEEQTFFLTIMERVAGI